jgi:NAD-dependent deacetylase
LSAQLAGAVIVTAALPAALRRARALVVLTGAGVSAESGIRTFREAQRGLWAAYDPEQVASPAGFRRDPTLVWDWYAERRERIESALPNPAHRALALLEARSHGFDLITQNIDGLHQAAGSQRVIELHGNIRRVKCFDCGRGLPAAEAGEGRPPHCRSCGGLLRPDVVWFGESLARSDLGAALDAVRSCDLLLSIGTSSQVEPAASLAFEALARKAQVIEINPEPTPLSPWADCRLAGPAGQILPALLAEAWPEDAALGALVGGG